MLLIWGAMTKHQAQSEYNKFFMEVTKISDLVFLCYSNLKYAAQIDVFETIKRQAINSPIQLELISGLWFTCLLSNH